MLKFNIKINIMRIYIVYKLYKFERFLINKGYKLDKVQIILFYDYSIKIYSNTKNDLSINKNFFQGITININFRE